MNLKSVVSIIDADNPSNPPLVLVQDINGTTYPIGSPIEVVDDLIGGDWNIVGVGNFQIGNGIFTNILLQPSFM